VIKLEVLKPIYQKLQNEKKLLITDKVKSISGILKTNKSYEELRDEVIVKRIQKYEDII